MSAPKVFISYSHDTSPHKQWVLQLASDLRSKGIDVVFDQWDLAPGQDVSLFMQRGIANSDRVILICSSNYVSKADNGMGGVGYERLIVTTEVVQSIDTIKFIPIVRNNNAGPKIPIYLGPRLYLDFTSAENYQEKLDALVREIHGIAVSSKPPLGPNPFSGTPISVSSGNGRTTPPIVDDASVFDDDWFLQQSRKAQEGIKKVHLTGYMELRFRNFYPFKRSQIELLNAVKQSEVRTFGWPIGITLENRDEYRPRPYGDGIRAEVSISDGSTGRDSYDYWALRANGDFFLLQSLFEDSRRSKEIFFDTRIVRVTESLMFAENLYSKLGTPPEAKIALQFTHKGLEGRTLTSASPNRSVFPRTSAETTSSSEVRTTLGAMKGTRMDDVRKVLEPMFMLFDFMEFQKEVYEDIVGTFERGQVR